MKSRPVTLVGLVAATLVALPAAAQAPGSKYPLIDVWPADMPALAPASERAKQEEYVVDAKNRVGAPDTVVLNVTHPTLEVVRPTAKSNGAALVVVPGGGFRVLSYTNEGVDVAEWAAAHGFTAFVLKYRLHVMPGKDEGGEKLLMGGGPAPPARNADGEPSAATPQMTLGPFEKDGMADGLQALKVVRAHAAEYGIDPDRVGIVGFSAGGVVAGSTAIADDQDARPNFVGIIYSHVPGDVPEGAPPAFFAAAADDPIARSAPDDFNRWLKSGAPAEIHVYAKGEHGFGTYRQNLPVDNWLDAFYAWIAQQGFTAE